MDAMDDLTTDQLSDPEYALPVIRAYLLGGGILSPAWALALVNEIEKLWGLNVEAAAHAVSLLTDEERMDVFGPYCRFCGRNDPKCQCWNDE